MIFDIQMIAWRLWMFFAGLEWPDLCCALPLLLYAIGIIPAVFLQMILDDSNEEEEEYEEDDWDENVDTFTNGWQP